MACQGPEQPLDDLLRQTKAIAKLLTVAELKNVLRHEGLPLSGVKSELQIRIIARIERAYNEQDRRGLERIKGRINPARQSAYATSSSYPSPFSNHTPNSSLSPQYATTPSRMLPGANGYSMSSSHRSPSSAPRVSFPDSPFYTIRYPLSHVHECKVRETTRDTASISLILSQSALDEIDKSNAAVMVFCAAEGKPSEIAFPHQVELKVNGNEVKTNLRGLKNKPGSTRPADITKYIRKKTAGLTNTVEMTYALTTKKFHLLVNLVRKKTVDNLVQDVLKGLSISKEQVLRELQLQAADPDIITTSSVMSLKCPLSYMRIKTPCRAIGCKHNQCFDATSYLQLQEQAPTWTCPICNKAAPWSQLLLDRYIQDILQSTSDSTEEVTIEPDGTWHLGHGTDSANAKANAKRNPTPESSYEGDSDDGIEIIENPTSVHLAYKDLPGLALTPGSASTPSMNSRNVSQAPSSTPASQLRSSKRPVSDVIDLTSDNEDEDDEPPTKRQRPSSLSATASSFHPRPPDFAVNSAGMPAGTAFSFSMPPPTSSAPLTQSASPASTFDFGGNGYGGSY